MYFLEGNIGTGKSTFLAAMAKHAENINVTFEPVDEWMTLVNKSSSGLNLLQEFYKDQERYAYTFQSVAFRSRIRLLRSLPTDVPNLVERSVFTDRNVFAKTCYESGKMNDIEWNDYCEWFDWLAADVKPSGYVYLRCDPYMSYYRMKIRSRPGESVIPYDYIEKIHKKHENWLLGEPNVLILDVNRDFEKNEKKLNEMIQQVKEFCVKSGINKLDE